MDVKLAKASTYTLAVAIYLDRSFDRDQSEKVTVCVDVRAGRGWPNTHALRLIPFMKHSMKLLLPLFPERLQRALVYPVPAAFFYIWTIISKYMDPLTVERVRILEGKCKIEAPPPAEAVPEETKKVKKKKKKTVENGDGEAEEEEEDSFDVDSGVFKKKFYTPDDLTQAMTKVVDLQGTVLINSAHLPLTEKQ